MSGVEHDGPELPVPPPCYGMPEAKEALRLWRTATGGVTYMVRPSLWTDPAEWGRSLADVIRYIAQCSEKEGLHYTGENGDPVSVTQEEITDRLMEALSSELDSPTGTPVDWTPDA